MTSLCLFLLSVALPINFLNMFFAVVSSSVRLTVVVARICCSFLHVGRVVQGHSGQIFITQLNYSIQLLSKSCPKAFEKSL